MSYADLHSAVSLAVINTGMSDLGRITRHYNGLNEI
jgi:hypothetical protein